MSNSDFYAYGRTHSIEENVVSKKFDTFGWDLFDCMLRLMNHLVRMLLYSTITNADTIVSAIVFREFVFRSLVILFKT